MKLSELKLVFNDRPEGWKHLHHLSKLRCNKYELPDETINFFVDFADAMLEQFKNLKDADRKDFNDKIRTTASKKLSVLKATKGNIAISDMSHSEFSKTKSWDRASKVLSLLQEEPILTEKEAIEMIATDDGVTDRTVERSWKKLKKRYGSSTTSIPIRWNRENAQQQQLAEKIANRLKTKSRLLASSITVKVPHSILKFVTADAGDDCVNLATRTPTNPLKESNHFHDEYWAYDSSDYLAHVLEQCVLVDDESYTAKEWSDIYTPLVIFISEQIVAKLERRDPRKYWP